MTDEREKTVKELFQEMKGLFMGIILGNNTDEEDFENLIRINDIINAIIYKFDGLDTDLEYYKNQYIRTKVELEKLKKQ